MKLYRFSEFWMGIRSIVRLYEKMMKSVCSTYQLSMVEVDIIAFLKNHPQKDTAADIVELRMLSKAAVSKGVDLLIRKSFLERETDHNDRRKVHLKLTKKAEPVMKDIQRTQQNFTDLLFRDFSEEDYEMYYEFRERILMNVKSSEESGHNYEQ